MVTQEKESFADLLEESFGGSSNLVGSVIPGRVVAIDSDAVIVDVGLKSEGRIPLNEFNPHGGKPDLNVGDEVEVFLERMEGQNGEVALSREKARREEAWVILEKLNNKGENVTGVIFGRVKGGFAVDLQGAIAFLPGSQLDVRPIKDVDPLIGVEQPFQILKMDRLRGNIVVSRRAILEESRAEERTELIKNLKEGQTLEGVIKNITDYGAFIDLGAIDGLLHVTDISWRRVNHPSEVLKMGETIQVVVLRFNQETQRISLGMKQLLKDPWIKIEERYLIESKHKGSVTNVTDYGAFIELEAGVEGLVHVSELSWTKKNVHPSKILEEGQQLDVMILDMDIEKRRIGLGVKQCQENPWQSLAKQFSVGSKVEKTIRNVTEFGLFVGLTEDIDGMVHMNDLSWNEPGDAAIKKYKKGDTIEVKILEVDPERERVALGVKQLAADPFVDAISDLKKGQIVTCEVSSVEDKGIEVKFGQNLTAFIRKSDLARERSEQRTDRFAVGEKVDAKISNIDPKSRKVTLSIKTREIEEQKEVMKSYDLESVFSCQSYASKLV